MDDIWKKRFMWLASQDWVEGNVLDNMDIDYYRCFDEYIEKLLLGVDESILENLD